MTGTVKKKIIFFLSELAGAVGDFGTIIPLTLAVALVTGMNIGIILLFFGIWFIATGWYYGLPIPIEPMKAIAVIAIAEKMGTGEIAAAGLILGLLFLLMSYGPLFLWLETIIPVSVIRGIQLGLALLLIKSAAGFVLKDPFFSGVGLAVILAFLLFTLYRPQVPDLSALVLIGIGLAAGIAAEGFPTIHAFPLPVFFIPSYQQTLHAIYELVPSQMFLTITNAILATALLTRDLFQRDIPPARFSRTIGLMNIVSVPFGGFPMCHGAGGLAAQYRYGARTALASVFAGIIFCVVAFLFGSPETLLLIPVGVFGALLLFAAFEMGKHSVRTESVPVTVLIGVLAVVLSMTAAFIIGIIVALLLRRLGRTA